MPFSRESTPRWAFAAALAVLVTLLNVGCAHAPRGRESEPAPAPQARPRSEESRESPRNASPGSLDPSEEITPGELATIPDPVPTGQPAPTPPPTKVPGASESITPGLEGQNGDSKADTAPERPWRVQIFASESRDEAERVASAAGARLQAEAAIVYEPPLYKVRLGSFATEEEAQALRERAIRAGYSGAFRIRVLPGSR